MKRSRTICHTTASWSDDMEDEEIRMLGTLLRFLIVSFSFLVLFVLAASTPVWWYQMLAAGICSGILMRLRTLVKELIGFMKS